ncbi:MAG: ATP-binding protein [Treponema sp.]|nr:ATP-binding protein [Treponema sp.]
MLIQFSVSNFKSIKDEAVLSLVSGSSNKMGNTVFVDNLDILPSAVLYGANASGKSALIEAFAMMRDIVLNKNRIMLSTDELPANPFLLSTETENAATVFDIIFESSGKRYKYGFEYDIGCVYSEYLYVYESVRPTCVFDFDVEEESKISERYKELKRIKGKNKNFLFLWLADQTGNECANEVLHWFKECSVIRSNRVNENLMPGLRKAMGDEMKRAKIIELMKSADFGIEDVKLGSATLPWTSLPLEVRERLKRMRTINDTVELKKMSFDSVHTQYDGKNSPVQKIPFDMERDESFGTKSYFYLSASILNALGNGSLLVIDELDLSLHPLLSQKIVELFNNPQVNKNHAQLVFTTQDTNLLTKKNFHKSQVWFTEKDKYGATHLTSLIEYKNIDSKTDYNQCYIMGKYGAIPYLGMFDFIEEKFDLGGTDGEK